MVINRADRARRAGTEVDKTITSEARRDEHWRYMPDLARAVVQDLQDKPRAAETDASQTYDYVQFPVDITMKYHARTKRFTASLPRDRALAILVKIDEAKRMMWTERVRGPRAGMVIHQIVVKRAQVWVWQEKPRERQPHTITATTSHQVPSSATSLPELLVQGQPRTRRQNAWPSVPAESVYRQLLLYGNPWLCHDDSWQRPCCT